VQQGDTIQSMAAKMVMNDGKEQWFRVLNGLENANQLQAGQKVKIVTY
jgi:predicted Zn-dependent protease